MRHYVVIRYMFGADEDIESAPLFGHKRGDAFYHWHGPTRMTWPRSATIVKDYGMVDEGNDEALDELEVRYARDFPWKSEIAAGGGWLGPNGTFYPCRWREHIAAAEMIALEVYGTSKPGTEGYSTVDRLEHLGWIKLYDDFVVPGKHEITQAQIDTLGELLLVEGQEERMVSSIRSILESGF